MTMMMICLDKKPLIVCTLNCRKLKFTKIIANCCDVKESKTVIVRS